MAIVLKDRVKQTASAPGTGTITLGAAAAGFQAFSAIGNGNVTYFAIVDPVSGDWEVNYGTYTSSGTTLSRNATPLSSSAAGALVNFTGTVDVFCTYPSEKAIYEEIGGNVLVDGGPITVVGSGVTTYATFSAALGEMYANINSFAQFYAQNLNGGSSASTDIVAYNDLGNGVINFIDMGINSSNYTDALYPIFTPGSGYVYNDGGELIIGSATDDVVLFAGGIDVTDEAVRIDKTTKAVTTQAALNVGGALDITGAAVFGSTVLLDANPTTALQAATKQYVDNQVTAGLHIHEPVRVETTGNLTATYARAGATNINIIGIANGTDVSLFGTIAVGDQFYTGTAVNGLLANTAYFIVNITGGGAAQVSLTFGGAIVTGLTNGSFTQPAIINSGVGATLTNAGAQAALQIDGVNLATTNRVMVRLQTNGAENGVYTVTTVGDGSTNWVLTRATDSNQVNPADPNGVGTGDYYFTQEGTLNAGDSHVLTTEPNTMIIGYTTLTYTQFSGSVDYTGGTNITVAGQTISVSGTIAATLGGTGTSTVTTGDLLYGSGTNTWGKLAAGAGYKSLVMNSGGTNVEWNAVALDQSGAVSGNLPATNGGTGIGSYTLGDIVYSSAANTLSALAGNTTTTKKYLIQTGTGSVSAAPVWGTINGADVSGNISGSAGSVANALTLGTYLTGTSFNGSSAVTATVDATSANTASKVVARDSSGNFSAGTITATLSGAATSATTATNVAGGAANQLVYNSGAGTTTFATAPSASNQVLNWNGSAFTWAAGTISGVSLGSNLNSLTAGTYLTGTAYNGSAAQTWAVDATSANTASKVVARDASGNFSAGTITAALSGNATTASTATNLAGGSAGTIPYQSAAGTTSQLAAGTSGYILQSNGAAAPSWVVASTAAGVNNGTLTMAVSGTGLSGSATFTANQAGASTFTVTSNATNLNTASTIVARDASGNFVAGTITAALSGNATTATTLQTARTINGTSFNGSANITITANTTNTLTLGSYLTGTSFNGSAAVTAAVDATSANTASKVVARDGSGNFSAGTITAALSGNATSSGYAQYLASIDNRSLAPSSTPVNRLTFGFTSWANNNTSPYADFIALRSYQDASGGNDNLLMLNKSTIAMRVYQQAWGSATAYSSYADVLMTNNYNSYAPTLTGTGASGTWSIAVTGNAGTATTLQTARTIALSGAATGTATSFNGSANIDIPVTALNATNLSAGTVSGDRGVASGSTSTSFVKYNGTTAAAANFDGGTTTPTGTTRLNYGGYFYPTFLNLVGSGDTATAATHYFVETGTDGFVRPKTLANVKTELNVNTTSNLQINSLGVGTAASGTAGEIRATNNVTAYYSDDRLKTRLGSIENALEKVKTLDTFYYEANELAQSLGYKPVREVAVSAQQVQAIMPEVVAPAPIDDKYLTVRYERLVPLLLAAIKELEVKVANLETEGKA